MSSHQLILTASFCGEKIILSHPFYKQKIYGRDNGGSVLVLPLLPPSPSPFQGPS